MSSKSRKHTTPPAHSIASVPSTSNTGSEPASSGAPADIEHAEPTAKDFHEAEDILKVPRGRSKATYALLIFLLIFLTAVFVVLDYLPQSGGAGGNRLEMSWQRPGVGVVEYHSREWMREKRRFGLTESMLSGGGSNLEDAGLARYLVLDTLALDAGVRTTDEELVEQLRQFAAAMGGVAAYESRVRNMAGIGVREFEDTLRRMMRAMRFRSLMGVLATQPSSDSIESLWRERRKETAFEYTLVDSASYRDAALAENPDDATLSAWFDGLSEGERRRYEGPARTRAELVGVLLDGDQEYPELLLAYPDGDDVDPVARGRKYYDDFAYARFLAPEGSKDAAYRPYEDVAEQTVREAQLLAALRSFKTDLDTRIAAGETIDLAAEAERLGLERDAPEQALTQLEWRERGGLGGTYAAGQLTRLGAGAFSSGIIVERAGLTLARTNEQLPPSVPAFSAIRDRVLSDWADTRAKELATQELNDLRARFVAEPAAPAEGETDAVGDDSTPAPRASAEDFTSTVEAAGLTVGRRDWLDSGAPPDIDAEAASPAHAILRTRAGFLGLGEGELSEPLSSPDGRYVLLARSAGEREVPLDRMKPGDFTSILFDARQRAEFDWMLGADPFSDDKLRERYQIRITSQERPEEDPLAHLKAQSPEAP